MAADVSVVIAAYHVEAYIERAIRSALDQQGVNVEVIVVNDASTDGTLSVVSAINDPRVKIINLPVNAGPGGARNVGFDAAAAPWIAVLDGDDIFLPGRLARCLSRAKTFDADIVVDNIQIYQEANSASYPMFAPHKFARFTTISLADFIKGNQRFLGGETLGYLKPVFKTSFLRTHNLRYDPTLRIGEDYILMCEALASGGRCMVEPSAGYRYTVRKGSISHRLTLPDIERMVEGDNKFLARHKLEASAQKAQNRRNFRLKEARAFTHLIEAVKNRQAMKAVSAILECPTAVWHMWRPAAARLKKLFK